MDLTILFISNMLCILVQMTLEEAIGYVASDELIEVHFPIITVNPSSMLKKYIVASCHVASLRVSINTTYQYLKVH